MRMITQGLSTASIAAKQADTNHTMLELRLQELCEGIRTEFKAQELILKTTNTLLDKMIDLVHDEIAPQLKEHGNSNTKVLEIVKNLQTKIPDPDIRFTWFQEPCRFEDARGHRMPIPSEFNFGASLLFSLSIKDLFLLELANNHLPIACSEESSLIPGMSFRMAIVMKTLRNDGSKVCPMPHCGSASFNDAPGGGHVCSDCGVWFAGACRVKETPQVQEIADSSDDERPTKRARSSTYSSVSSNSHMKEDKEILELAAIKNVRVPEPSDDRTPSKVEDMAHPQIGHLDTNGKQDNGNMSTTVGGTSHEVLAKSRKGIERQKVKKACVYCRRSHMTCDAERPCTRCIKRNIGHICRDEPQMTAETDQSQAALACAGNPRQQYGPREMGPPQLDYVPRHMKISLSSPRTLPPPPSPPSATSSSAWDSSLYSNAFGREIPSSPFEAPPGMMSRMSQMSQMSQVSMDHQVRGLYQNPIQQWYADKDGPWHPIKTVIDPALEALPQDREHISLLVAMLPSQMQSQQGGAVLLVKELTFGDERPCQHCIKRGLADACRDGIGKKAKYLHDAPPEALRPVLGPNYKTGQQQ
ncbi:hypothetical protein B7463_g11955, partial [Scytalidium lignicola]